MQSAQVIKPFRISFHGNDHGFMMIESMGSLLFYLIMVAAAILVIGLLMSGSKLSEMQQGLMSTRMQIQQLFSGSHDYTGLNNEVVIKAGIIPKRFIKGNDLQNPWGGNFIVEAGSDVGSFTISVDKIPQEECTKMATYEKDTWDQTTVNGEIMDKSNNLVAATAACSDTNTIVYQAR